MNNATVNGEIRLGYRDGFGLMDDEELKKYFGVSENYWGIHDKQQHTVISIAWSKVGGFLALLADTKNIVGNIGKRMKKNLKDFEKGSDITADIGGIKAEGFSFGYTVNDADIKQVGKVLSFRVGKCFYILHFVTRADHENEANEDLEKILASVSVG